MRRFVFILLVCGLMAACDRGPAEVLVTSQPDGAEIVMQGARIGQTPMKVSVREATAVEVRLAGFQPRTATLTPDGEPNVILKLEPLAVEKTAAAPASASTAPADRTASRPAPASTGLRQLKEMYRAGEIDKVEYQQRVNRAKSRYDEAVRNLKERYRRGEIDRVEYDQRVRHLKSELSS